MLGAWRAPGATRVSTTGSRRAPGTEGPGRAPGINEMPVAMRASGTDGMPKGQEDASNAEGARGSEGVRNQWEY